MQTWGLSLHAVAQSVARTLGPEIAWSVGATERSTTFILFSQQINACIMPH